MKLKKTVLLGAVIAGLLGSSVASANEEQFIGLPSYRVGPYAAGGSGLFGGWIDYMQLINERDGGVNGVKLTWEECANWPGMWLTNILKVWRYRGWPRASAGWNGTTSSH